MSRRPPIAALILGVLLLLMGAGQLSDVAAFAEILRTWDTLGGSESALAVLVPALELTAAVGLLSSRTISFPLARGAGLLGLAIALFWSALAVQAFARGLAIENCGCFGVYLGQELRWWVLLQDVYFLVLAWYAAVAVGVGLPRPRLRAMSTP